jgi:outer membrane protein OmpA-like peptidoglycan-associated protein
MKKGILVVLLLSVVFMLTACTHATSRSERQYQKVVTCLRLKGARIEELGDNVYAFVPTSTLFAGKSARLISQRFTSVDCVADWLQYHPETAIEIMVYTNELATAKDNQLLSEARADRIHSYLWGSHIKSNFLYVIGKGSSGITDYALGKNYMEIVFNTAPING